MQDPSNAHVPQGPATNAGPSMQVVMNVQQSRRLAYLAIRADQVIRRGLNRLGRGRLKAAAFEQGAQRIDAKIRELDKLLEETLVGFVPQPVAQRGRKKPAGTVAKPRAEAIVKAEVALSGQVQ